MSEDHPFAITSTSSHLTPDEVAHHTFGSARRGFDPDEVRAYLESVANGLRLMSERELQLLQELADAERRAANPVLDEPTLTAAVGTETARVLHSAHEVAADLVARSEAEAAQVLSDTEGEIGRRRAEAEEAVEAQAAEAEASVRELRDRTERESADRLEAGRREADEIVTNAREQCRDMVEEAQALRSRVLGDLSKRRRVLHAQIEQLRAGRERLAETVQDVRRSVDSIAGELFAAEDNARLAAEAAGREALERVEDQHPEELAAILVEEPSPGRADVASGPAGGKPEEVGADERAGTEEAAEVPTTTGAVGEPTGDDGGGVAEPETALDVLFAKLRAATAGAEHGEVGEEEGPPAHRHPVAIQRDELLDPIVTTLARRLKRILQDGQNELLDGVRSNDSRWSDSLLPDETEQTDSFSTAALPALEQAAEAGRSVVAPTSEGRPETDVLLGMARELAEAITGPLRRRLAEDASLDDSDEAAVAEHIGSAFREWKGERIERLAGDQALAAFSAGTAAAAAEKSVQLEWVAVAGPSGEACPDCEDNGLNGAQAAGEEFPTGHRHPPAHPGCRCLLAPAVT